MKFIEFKKNLCDDCYKCLRTCPTKAIVINGNKKNIDDNLCIKCGICQGVCPQGALIIQNDLIKIKTAINNGKKVVATVAPSYIAGFSKEIIEKFTPALKMLGFYKVEETAIGADYVADAYKDVIIKGDKNNILTSCCPSANYYIEKYYPDLIKEMIPVLSPMIVHGKILKEKYGRNIFTVFIGPCLAKKAEAEEFSGYIDAVLTFNELDEWFKKEKIDFDILDKSELDCYANKRGSAFPLGGSLYDEDLKGRINQKYRYIRVDGIDDCKDILSTLNNDNLHNYCIEINICKGSCLNGPDYPKDNKTYYEREAQLNSYIKNYDKKSPLKYKSLDITRSFNRDLVKLKQPNENEIKELLLKIGKYDITDQLNCGACGYDSCIEKIIYSFNGMSDPKFCLPYLRDKAEKIQSTIFEHTPNLITILNEDLEIIDINPMFNKQFSKKGQGASINIKGFPIDAFIDKRHFVKVLETKENLIKEKIYLGDYDKSFYLNIIYLGESKALLTILTDITLEEKSMDELKHVKQETLLTCQEVINKQMRVAQEIASLLGETTAETKVSLNHLKDIVLGDKGGI